MKSFDFYFKINPLLSWKRYMEHIDRGTEEKNESSENLNYCKSP